MHEVFDLARRYGVEICYADLGDWGGAELRSEYDPEGPAIRVNTRVLARLAPGEAEHFAAFAVAHELYHHREHQGEVARLPRLQEREHAADDFARAIVGSRD
jgi:hypothetical protein